MGGAFPASRLEAGGLMEETRTILHLGVGAFFRAHQAAYLQALLDLGERGWRLAAGNIRADMAAVEAALITQGGAYVLETVSPAGARAWRTINVLSRVIPYREGLAQLIAVGADPATQIISMTVTEAGYFLTPDRRLIEDAVDMASDLGAGSRRTIYGALAAILAARREVGAGPVTLLSCDNLRANGDRLNAGLRAFLARRGEAALTGWCDANVTTPNTMVDRITPRSPADLAERVAMEAGWRDACPVMAEEFQQWVIEDRFAAGRPALERVGVTFTPDVTPYEEAKIRILNASHSILAWAGVLKGYGFIHEDASDPVIAAIARAYVAEAVIPNLASSPMDLAAYAAATLERFGNPHIRDTNSRVVADSWSKLATFVAPTIAESLSVGVGLERAAAAPALFLLFMERWRDGRLGFDYQDQALDADAMRGILGGSDPVTALCAEPRLWGDLVGDGRLTEAVRVAYGWVRGVLEV